MQSCSIMYSFGAAIMQHTEQATWSLDADLADVLRQTAGVWPQLRDARLFISGGTGFIGRWLLESLRHAERELGLGIHATILSRDPAAFMRRAPHLADHPGFEFIAGDVCRFTTPPGEFTHVIHAATDASAQLNENDPLRMFDTVVAGTRRMLDFCVEKSVRRMLFLSSGAIYGAQPPAMERVDENMAGGPNCLDPRAAYAEAKRSAEMLCAIYQKQFGCRISVARIFAVLGPFLPLGAHFAAGNFIQDAMQGKTVTVGGNGRPLRSYLYASDLTVWLWHMLTDAPAGKAYNLGCDEAVSVAQLAERVAAVVGNGSHQVLGAQDNGWNTGRYVPDTSAIRNDLGVGKSVMLDEAIRRTAIWNGWTPK
jgi:nucleoside-diphosphate-sugar epimerase